MWVAKTMREKKLPCDALIYLGTDFTPSGWNTHNGEFTWKTETFPEPKKAIDELHALNYKVVLHVVIEGRRLHGTVKDECKAPEPSGRTPEGQWPPDRQRRLLLAASQGRVRSRRRWLVAGSGGRTRSAVAPESHPHVLGRRAALASRPARVRAASQRVCGDGALRRVPLVRRRPVDVGNAEDARAGRGEYRPERHSVLGNRYRRIRADARSSPASSTSAGSSSARSVRCSDRTAARGICGCHGDGTSAKRGRESPRPLRGRRCLQRRNCATSRSSRSAGSTWSCGIA